MERRPSDGEFVVWLSSGMIGWEGAVWEVGGGDEGCVDEWAGIGEVSAETLVVRGERRVGVVGCEGGISCGV